MNVYIWGLGCDVKLQLLTDLLADAFLLGSVVFTLGAEAVYVNKRHLYVSMRGKEFADIRGRYAGNVGVESDECVEESYGRSG